MPIYSSRIRRILDKWPGKQRFGVYRFLPAFHSMMAGSQLVHLYYKPLNDINVYIEREMKAANAQNADEKPTGGKNIT